MLAVEAYGEKWLYGLFYQKNLCAGGRVISPAAINAWSKDVVLVFAQVMTTKF